MNPDLPPFEKDSLEPSPSTQPKAPANQPLSEKDFIQNRPTLTSFPFWLWLFLITAIAAILLGTRGWYDVFLQKEKSHEPFLEVTNREFSVFLWQFPSFLRANVAKKAGYLPGFLFSRENINPAMADEFVSAPPSVIFLYHTWSRLLAPDFIMRPLSPTEFAEFLEQSQEWQPSLWKAAPVEYVQLIDSKSYLHVADLQTLPPSTLPLIVRQAFQGWKNYFQEGPQINDMQPTFAQVVDFLKQHPTYARNYWRNIDEVEDQPIAGLNYLRGLLQEIDDPEEKVPKDQLSSFLKVALFNFEQAKESQP